MSNNLDIWALLTVAIGIVALFVLFILTILFIYQRKTFEHREKVTLIEQNRKQEILKAQIEVQDQTLSYVSREIHDNIGQVLSFIKLSLGTAGKDAGTTREKINESRELLSQVISDLRDLSKSLSFDGIKATGLINTITFELERINKSGLLNAIIAVTGEPYTLDEQRELVLFRIVQEAVNNALKHANAQELTVLLSYSPNQFLLEINDNGDGFYTGILEKPIGSGLKNIQNRALLIGAEADISSTPGHGSIIKITLDPLAQHNYAGTDYTDRVS